MRIPIDVINKIANYSITLIKERTLKGIDANDRPFKEYSRNPFKIPVAGSKTALKYLESKDKSSVSYFMRNGKHWAVVHNGYLAFKSALYRNSSWDGKTVNLWNTGLMLKSLTVLRVNQSQFVIGFTNADASERAYYNLMRGRNFFGLSKSDISKLNDKINL